MEYREFHILCLSSYDALEMAVDVRPVEIGCVSGHDLFISLPIHFSHLVCQDFYNQTLAHSHHVVGGHQKEFQNHLNFSRMIMSLRMSTRHNKAEVGGVKQLAVPLPGNYGKLTRCPVPRAVTVP